MSDQQDIDRGARAQALLDNTLLWECFDDLEAAYLEAWKNTIARDVDGREQTYAAITVLGKVRSHLQKMIDDGKLAQRTIEEVTRTPAAHRK